LTRILPELPPNAPRSGGNAFGRAFAEAVLRLGRWRLIGEWPDRAKLVVVVAPHSSNWDAIWGIAAKVAQGLGIVFIGKQEAFWGPLGWLLRLFGGVPVDRSAPGGIVDQVANQMREAERMWFVLAPEGTRRKVDKWKTGFWKIARRAQVPVFCVAFNYPDRTIHLGPLVWMTEDMEADVRRVRGLFAGYHGKNRNV
jgi:1-acyl-sn-glycerol-3-phosphate acyltransferase